LSQGEQTYQIKRRVGVSIDTTSYQNLRLAHH